MSNKKCGSCRFFEDAGMASSGWCRHPNRVEIQNLVLVRKSELACRNSWDQDLWEDRKLVRSTKTDSVSDSSGNRTNGRLPSRKPADCQVHQIAEESSKTDHVYAIEHAPVNRFSEHGLVNQPDRTSQPAGYDIATTSVTTASPGRQERIEPNQLNQASTYSVLKPNRQEATEPKPESGPAGRLHDEFAVKQKRKQRSWEQHPPTVSPVADHEVQIEQKTEPLPKDIVRSHSYRHGSGFRENDGQYSPFITLDEPKTIPESGGGQEHATPVTPPSNPENTSFHEQPADEVDPIDRSPLMDGIVRCCGTCLDFLPSGDGTTGTCTNAYAFSVQRMVKSDELACRTSIGIWWLPNHDIVHDKANIVRHTSQTPFLDSFLNRGN